MNWNKEIRDKIAYGFATAAFIAGWALTVAGFIVNPLGMIDDSVLWALGQALVFAGGVIGVTLHVNNLGVKIKDELKTELTKTLKK